FSRCGPVTSCFRPPSSPILLHAIGWGDSSGAGGGSDAPGHRRSGVVAGGSGGGGSGGGGRGAGDGGGIGGADADGGDAPRRGDARRACGGSRGLGAGGRLADRDSSAR